MQDSLTNADIGEILHGFNTVTREANAADFSTVPALSPGAIDAGHVAARLANIAESDRQFPAQPAFGEVVRIA